MMRGGETLSLVLERKADGDRSYRRRRKSPSSLMDSAARSRIGMLGIKNNGSTLVYQKKSIVEALELGVGRTWFVIETTFRYIGKLFIGQESTDQLGGADFHRQGGGRCCLGRFRSVYRSSSGSFRSVSD